MVTKRWTVDDAQGHLRDVLEQAATDGPQTISDATGRIFEVVMTSDVVAKSDAQRPQLTVGDIIERGRGRLYGASVSEDERQENAAIFEEFALRLEDIRREGNAYQPTDMFAWLDEMTDHEFEEWSARMEQNRQRWGRISDDRQ